MFINYIKLKNISKICKRLIKFNVTLMWKNMDKNANNNNINKINKFIYHS